MKALVILLWLSTLTVLAQDRSCVLLDPSPVGITSRGIEIPLSLLLTAYDALSLTDYSLTQRGLQSGAVEGNPFMMDLVNNRPAFLAAKTVGIMLVNMAVKAAWKYSHIGAYVIAVLAIIAQGFVDVHNLHIVSGR